MNKIYNQFRKKLTHGECKKSDNIPVTHAARICLMAHPSNALQFFFRNAHLAQPIPKFAFIVQAVTHESV